MTPVTRRSARFFTVEVFKPPTKIVRLMLAVRPRWLQHIELCTTTDGDNYLMREVERALGDDVTWRSYVPVGCDGLVLAYRRWMDARARLCRG